MVAMKKTNNNGGFDMGWFLYIISFIWIGLGTVIILYTENTRKILPRLVSGHNLKILGSVSMIMGIFLFLSASLTHHQVFVSLFGLIAVVKGALLLVNPRNMADDIIKWYLDKATDQTFRLGGITLLVLGTVLLSWVR